MSSKKKTKKKDSKPKEGQEIAELNAKCAQVFPGLVTCSKDAQGGVRQQITTPFLYECFDYCVTARVALAAQEVDSKDFRWALFGRNRFFPRRSAFCMLGDISFFK